MRNLRNAFTMIEVVFVVVIGAIIMSVVFSPSEQEQIKNDLVSIKKQAIEELHKTNIGVAEIKTEVETRMMAQSLEIKNQNAIIEELKHNNIVLKAQKATLEAQLEALTTKSMEPEVEVVPEPEIIEDTKEEPSFQFDYESDYK